MVNVDNVGHWAVLLGLKITTRLSFHFLCFWIRTVVCGAGAGVCTGQKGMLDAGSPGPHQ